MRVSVWPPISRKVFGAPPCEQGWARLRPLGVQASVAERNLGIDFTSGKQASTVELRARLE